MQIGMLDHFQKWIVHFIKTHERLDKYNAIWLAIPAYHDLTPNNMSFEIVAQWNGNKMKEVSWYQHGVVTKSLGGRSPVQSSIFNPTIQCPWALSELYMYARYKSHNDATYVRPSLCRASHKVVVG
jgi:hypothetical protein